MRCGVAAVEFHVRRFDRQPSAVGHRVARVDHQIQQYLLDLARVCLHAAKFSARQERHVNVFADHAREHPDHSRDRVVHVQHARLQDLLAAEGQQLARESGGPVGGFFHLLDAEAQRRGIRHAFQKQLGVALYHHQQIVEIVRHAPGEFADGLHLLRLAQLIGQALALGDVQRDSNHALNRALAIAQRLHVRFEPPLFPRNLIGDRLPLQGSSMRRDRRSVVVLREEEVQDRQADRLESAQPQCVQSRAHR